MSGSFKVGDVVKPNWYPGDETTVLAVGEDRFGYDNHVEQVVIVRSDGLRVKMRAAHFDLVRAAADSGEGDR